MSRSEATFPIPAFYSSCTVQPSRDDLLREIGELHLRLERMRQVVNDAERVRSWLHQQQLVVTPSICCAGSELERRVAELDAVEEIARRGRESAG
jgi:hypothetical protein